MTKSVLEIIRLFNPSLQIICLQIHAFANKLNTNANVVSNLTKSIGLKLALKIAKT